MVWATVLVMGIAVIFEPIRMGLAVLMLNRPRPMLQLLAFLCGGFAMGVGVGVVVLFILRSTPIASGRFTLPQVQITVGLLALLIAAALATNISARMPVRRPMAGAVIGGEAGMIMEEPAPPSALEKLSARARHLLRGDSLWVAGVSGLATALPSANYMAALAVILASGATPTAQVQALILFNVMAFTLAEIPLVSYLAAPQKTRASMTALHAWLRSRRRREVAALVALTGCVMLTLGVTGLSAGSAMPS
jgi:Sap, sulfolipid-1-addressing protein